VDVPQDGRALVALGPHERGRVVLLSLRGPAQRDVPEMETRMTETGWLIESYHKSMANRPMWLRLFSYKTDEVPKPEWTENADVALRFGREVDAALFAMLYPSICCLARPT